MGKDRARLLSDRMRGNGPPAGKQEVLISSVEKNLPHEGGQTLEQGPREAVRHSHLHRVLSDLS